MAVGARIGIVGMGWVGSSVAISLLHRGVPHELLVHDLRPHLADEVRRAAYEIIRRKGATNHAIGLATAALLRWALRDERRVLTVSRLQTGAGGVRGVALSLPALVSRTGAVEVLTPEMAREEAAALERSAAVLAAARRRLGD